MALTYRLSVDELARTRFAISPVNEAALSLWVLTDTGCGPLPHLAGWLRDTRARSSEYDVDTLFALTSTTAHRLPDFITPLPGRARPTLDDECETIAATPADVVVRDLLTLSDEEPGPTLRTLLDDPEKAATLIAEALHRYWHAAIAPIWPVLLRILEADVTHRGRELGLGGAGRALAGISPSLTWLDDGGVAFDSACHSTTTVAETGEGLVLTPSAFVLRPITWASPLASAPWVSYPVRGAGELGERQVQRPPAALERLIGAAKAHIVVALDESPSSTTQLAQHLGVTAGAVSQSLRVLADNGLVDRTRHGREVLYRLTDTGRRLRRS
ncbi:transcriptional regulator [Rhodococcus rhodnii]|uniref:HTH arsR-type domain-containing protein n=2 Tax=Rhodococcus rhodnii TaxID=38312 RepID=R7WHM4_9NOCA|nr:DUF5937 family protein [Rhodococcus rhodnii]EOM74572.1 hypothetical protein Rrhod_4044 [Rhodococcus rhodnii LMG 5362]TXG89421.1 transcriptional regulator [Rhodococcus rhodnii]